ncbi:mechanosensitive ion channel [Leptolyngbya sp. PL-A3]
MILLVLGSPAFGFTLSTGIAQTTILTNLTTGEWAVVAMGSILALAIILHLTLGRLARRSWLPFLQTTIPQPEGAPESRILSAETLYRTLLLGSRTVLWVGVGLALTQLFPITRVWSDRVLWALVSSFTAPILSLGRSQYSLKDIILLVVMILALIAMSKTVAEMFKRRILSLARINRGMQEAIAVIFRYILIVIGVMVLLQVWGLDISSLAILASALSVGVGFGLQDIAKNFGSGLVLVFERPIQVGDFVEIGECIGTIERIGARSTLIRTLDQVSIIMPNSRFLEHEVINWSHDNPLSRLHVPVGVAYGSDTEQIRGLLLEATQNHPHILSHPKPTVMFTEFGENSLNFELLVWTREPSLQAVLKSDLNFRIERLLRQNGIEIPFPQRDLNVRGTLPVTLPDGVVDALQQMAGQTSPVTKSTADTPTDS